MHAEVLFEDGFENIRTIGPNPVLNWKPAFDPMTNPSGAMYGNGDVFSRSTLHSIEGSFSLQLKFDGRHGWCNTCTKTFHTMANGYDDVDYFIDWGKFISSAGK